MNKGFQNISKIRFEDIKAVFMLFLATIPSMILRWRYKDIWFLVERINSADDNSWFFFQWMLKNHPEQKTYFVLGKNAIKLCNQKKHMIVWGSFKHYIFYLAANVHARSVFLTPRPNNRICSYYETYFRKNLKAIYLRHGISKDGLEHHKFSVQKVRLFICGAKHEFDYINEYGGYPKGYVQYTGFARFDYLIDQSSKYRFIMLMPTWRRYLSDSSLSESEKKDLILQSEYFSHYQSLINNPSLFYFLQKNNYKLIFCLHPEFSEYKYLFKTPNNNIQILNNSEISIHKLLIEASLLITDYSSVFFDFAYMLKPILFYQFDYKVFREKHFSQGYFSYKDDAMGSIHTTEIELVQQIWNLYDGKKFFNPEPFIKRCHRFFPKRDTHNCERIYEEIKKIV